MRKIILSVVLAAIVLLGIAMISTYISVSNTEIAMRKQVEAQDETCAGYYDKMWKIISQKAQVSQEYKNSFKDIYVDIIAGRYEKGDGSLMKWITEANPNFDVSLYKDLQRSIEVERNAYLIQEKKLIDLDREHDTYIAVFPNSLIVGDRGETEITLIRSTRTNKARETGIDDNVNVF